MRIRGGRGCGKGHKGLSSFTPKKGQLVRNRGIPGEKTNVAGPQKPEGGRG